LVGSVGEEYRLKYRKAGIIPIYKTNCLEDVVKAQYLKYPWISIAKMLGVSTE